MRGEGEEFFVYMEDGGWRMEDGGKRRRVGREEVVNYELATVNNLWWLTGQYMYRGG